MSTPRERDTLSGRVALVTGAGIRVGRAIALALGARGMHVVVHYNGSRDGAMETARLIRDAGGEATVEQANLADAADAERLIDRVVSVHVSLWALVNSAAVMLRTPLGEVSTEQWDSMFALNVRAPFFLAQRAAPAYGATVQPKRTPSTCALAAGDRCRQSSEPTRSSGCRL